MAAPGGLGHLTGALRFWLGQKPLRDRRRRHVRFGPYVIGYLEGDPNQVGSLLAIVGTARMRFDALKQRPGLVRAELDFLGASEQFEALKHGALHLRRDETFGLRLSCPV
jgi:hypothetical protein